MKTAILHHHMHPGGVTRVIEMQLQALSAYPEITSLQLITGDEKIHAELPNTIEQLRNPLLNYLDCKNLSPAQLNHQYIKIIEYLLEATDADTVIHVHNINLGKNPVMTAAIHALMENGRAVVNHVHDFAEDRPENLSALLSVIEGTFGRKLHNVMYPTCPDCRYAVLTRMDKQRLVDYGIPQEQITVLPNPACVGTPLTGKAAEEAAAKVNTALQINNSLPNYVYPVRGIRRKNIGEFILLAAVFADKANWILTLPPRNPVEKVEYDNWKEFCQKNNIKVIFEAGEKCAFKAVMAAADRAVTTSIREGFGMIFLEAWLFGKPVVGRDLPVSEDFKRAGVKMPGLYHHLLVDVPDDGEADFGMLPQEIQMKIIERIISESSSRLKFLEENETLKAFFRDFSIDLINSNCKIIKKEYSLEKYGQELLKLYKTLI
ncbi:glycosyltransferase family 4 protein [Lentisphaerota bacterium ZTH]|nr:glycosyltransferase family 4 protein [Lentisphaerota bacterium]WET07376.1 glycosyltransferase family 4 protein [Lentisphaerota bacterium ZTH]